MAITLGQDVAHKEQPAGTDWIFTITSTNVAGNYKFKYIADLYLGSTGTDFKVRLKFSPNGTNRGIINLSEILEQYVSSDNLGSTEAGNQAEFKGVSATAGSEMPIHCIDKLSLNTNNVQRLTIKWGEEYSTNATDAPTEYLDELVSSNYLLWNGVAYNNEQELIAGEYGINLTNWNSNNYLVNSITSRMLTDAPRKKQYIGDNEYSTLSFLAGDLGVGDSTPDTYVIDFWDSSSNFISSISTTINASNGGYTALGTGGLTTSSRHLQYLGVGTANFKGAGFTIPANWAFYSVYLKDGASAVSDAYEYHKRNEDCKKYEKIRLCWLNKFGTWDYYTFTKKNTRATDIKRTEFNKVKGNWNGSTYTKYGYERGRGILSTSAVESIKLNSDWFTNDEEAAWIEQLFISPEVYIINDYDTNDIALPDYGKYMIPVVVTDKSFDRYTRANDKVAQYELEIEYSHNKRIQRA